MMILMPAALLIALWMTSELPTGNVCGCVVSQLTVDPEPQLLLVLLLRLCTRPLALSCNEGRHAVVVAIVPGLCERGLGRTDRR